MKTGHSSKPYADAKLNFMELVSQYVFGGVLILMYPEIKPMLNQFSMETISTLQWKYTFGGDLRVQYRDDLVARYGTRQLPKSPSNLLTDSN